MNIMMNLFKYKNQLLGTLAPDKTAKGAANLFLTPRTFPHKKEEIQAEQTCKRISFGDGLSAARWGKSDRKILLVHGWESRSTQMYPFVSPLLENNFEVIAIDAPGHGHSSGKRPNPVSFSKAIITAQEQLGPFYGTIGHSMGAAAISIAMESGAQLGRCVLISSPACLYDSLKNFANFIGLPPNSARRFIHHVEQEVGRPAKDLDVGRVFAALKPEALLIHAVNDREIPYRSMERIASACPEIKTYTSKDLGHRRIIRSPEISKLTSDFLVSGSIAAA